MGSTHDIHSEPYSLHFILIFLLHVPFSFASENFQQIFIQSQQQLGFFFGLWLVSVLSVIPVSNINKNI